MLPVVEIFYSLQGEGRYIGHPSVFLRLAGCNLGCPGFPCDTPRAIDARRYSAGWDRFESADEIIESINKAILLKTSVKPKHIVITGGEPTLHFSNHIFLELAQKLLCLDYKITVETNGTIDLDFEGTPLLREFTYAMSIKLSNSDELFENRVKPSVINTYAEYAKECFLKFVVNKNNINLDIYDEIIGIKSLIKQDIDIFCMPQGSTREELEITAKSVFEFCSKYGFIYSDRIHIRVYGKKDGV